MAWNDDEGEGGSLADPDFREGICNELNVLLESERAGAATLKAWREEGVPPEADAAFAAVAADQERYAAGLAHFVARLGGEPSEEVGQFFDKAMGVDGWNERVAFFNRGQSWIARVVDGLLPDVAEDADLTGFLEDMRDRHIANLDVVGRLAA